MAIIDVEICDFRNLERVKLDFEKGINIVYGDNGSGKTSILEALHLVSTGKSFRTSDIGKVIRREQRELLVLANVSSQDEIRSRIGLRKEKSRTEARVNGVAQSKQGEIAKRLPLLTITPESHRLIEAGPNWKRKFIDWGLFHVEQDFYPRWRDYKKCLQQRNLLLSAIKKRERSVAPTEIDSWDEQLAVLGEQIQLFAQQYLEILAPQVSEILRDLMNLEDVSLEYKRGWSASSSFLDALRAHRDRDIRLGFTELGIHRADLVIRIQGEDIRNKVSRGQQKLVIYALNLAQTELLKDKRNLDSTLLLDDLVAELDVKNTVRLLELIKERFTQAIVTTANRELIPAGVIREAGMFHVEHGSVVKH